MLDDQYKIDQDKSDNDDDAGIMMLLMMMYESL